MPALTGIHFLLLCTIVLPAMVHSLRLLPVHMAYGAAERGLQPRPPRRDRAIAPSPRLLGAAGCCGNVRGENVVMSSSTNVPSGLSLAGHGHAVVSTSILAAAVLHVAHPCSARAFPASGSQWGDVTVVRTVDEQPRMAARFPLAFTEEDFGEEDEFDSARMKQPAQAASAAPAEGQADTTGVLTDDTTQDALLAPQKEPEIKLSLTEKCFAAAFLGIAVGLPCVLCWVRSSPEVWDDAQGGGSGANSAGGSPKA